MSIAGITDIALYAADEDAGVQAADEVVATALHDLYRTKKDMSIHGLPVKFQVLLVKLLPHKLVMNTWLKQQKKAKNNTGLQKS